MMEETDLSANTYASEGGRESNRFLAYSRWDELGPLQFDMEDGTVNFIGVQKEVGGRIINGSRKSIRVSSVDKQYDRQEDFFFDRLITDCEPSLRG